MQDPITSVLSPRHLQPTVCRRADGCCFDARNGVRTVFPILHTSYQLHHSIHILYLSQFRATMRSTLRLRKRLTPWSGCMMLRSCSLAAARLCRFVCDSDRASLRGLSAFRRFDIDQQGLPSHVVKTHMLFRERKRCFLGVIGFAFRVP